MASPHIAGIVAALLSRPDFQDLTPAALKAKLIQDGSKGLISMGFLPPGHKTKNVFVYSHPDEKDTVEHGSKDESKNTKIETDEETSDFKVCLFINIDPRFTTSPSQSTLPTMSRDDE